MDIDLTTEPLGRDADGEPVYLSDIWPSAEEIADAVGQAVRADMFTKSYADVFSGRRALEGDRGPRGRPLHLARLDLRPPARASSRA